MDINFEIFPLEQKTALECKVSKEWKVLQLRYREMNLTFDGTFWLGSLLFRCFGFWNKNKTQHLNNLQTYFMAGSKPCGLNHALYSKHECMKKNWIYLCDFYWEYLDISSKAYSECCDQAKLPMFLGLKNSLQQVILPFLEGLLLCGRVLPSCVKYFVC